MIIEDVSNVWPINSDIYLTNILTYFVMYNALIDFAIIFITEIQKSLNCVYLHFKILFKVYNFYVTYIELKLSKHFKIAM